MKKRIILPLIFTVCVSILYLIFNTDDVKRAKPKKEKMLKPVSVTSITPASIKSIITVNGEAKSEWETNIKSNVDGKITYISKKLKVGESFDKGEILYKVDNTDYLLKVAEAQKMVKMAEINLLKEKREQQIAKNGWKASKIAKKPDSPLFFHIPQIEAAKAELEEAKKRLHKARNDLSDTTVKAPYTCTIEKVNVQKGGQIFSGDNSLTILSKDQIQIKISLSDYQLQMMPEKWHGQNVKVRSVHGRGVWQGFIQRNSGFIEEDRKSTFFVEVNNRNIKKPLKHGEFTIIEFSGKYYENILLVPEKSINAAGEVWYLDKDDKLQFFKTSPLFYKDDLAAVKAPEYFKKLLILINPEEGLIPGIKVRPVIEEL